MAISVTPLSTDVLVVGAGSAGTMAAIKAQMAGADVLVVTKGPFPSGNSSKAIAGYAAAFGHVDPRDNPDIHFGDVVRNGIGLSNQKMVKTWVNTICDLTEEMRGWGLDVIWENGRYDQIPWEGHTFPRMINHHRVTGKYLMKCLGGKSQEMGIEALTHTIVSGLFKEGERISGAWAVNYRTGEVYVISAKAVIMTTGGVGALYPVGDNVSTATGEGYAIAFNAGAEMIGMEFSHFLPTIIWPEAMHMKLVFAGFVAGLINDADAVLRNGRGERFMLERYPETGETKLTVEELTRRIGEEILNGNAGPHGGIIFDISEVDAKFETDDRYARMWELAKRGGVDIRKDPIELVCYPHDLVGGIKITERGETNVSGLFAAGEATGGSHGASRFGGSALSDCLVFGAIGAERAVAYARELNAAPTLDDGDIAAVTAKIEGWRSKEGGVDPGDIMADLRQIAGEHFNVARSEASIKQAFAKLSAIEAEQIPEMSVQADTERQTEIKIRQAIEAEGQITLCRLMGTASLERKESRGGYYGGAYRMEYPETDDENWKKNVVLRSDNGAIAVSHDEVVVLEEGHNDDMLKTIATKWEPPDDPEFYSITE